jgi:hypothetical protein
MFTTSRGSKEKRLFLGMLHAGILQRGDDAMATT